MPKKPTELVPLMVRMPEAIRRRLAKSAEENGRSLNGEVVWRLRQSLGVPEEEMTLREKMLEARERFEHAMALLDRTMKEGK